MRWSSGPVGDGVDSCVHKATIFKTYLLSLSGVSDPRPVGHMWSRTTMHVAQRKIISLLKTLFLLISFH